MKIRAAVVLLASAALMSTAEANASAAQPRKPALQVSYSVTGSTAVKSIATTVPLGPAALHTDLDSDGSFTGTLPLPSQTVSFVFLDQIVVTANLDFIPVGKVTGTLSGGSRTVVKAVARYRLRLSHLELLAGGFIPSDVGDTCESTDPVSIPVATPSGSSFDLDHGGALTGTYTIGTFSGCAGDTSNLINLVVPGSGNTVALTLTNGRMTQPTTTHATYPASGSNKITGTDNQVMARTALGATSLTATLGRSGAFAASLALPLQKLSFSFANKVKVTADVKFVREVKLTGTLTGSTTGQLTATGKYSMRVNKLVVGGYAVDTGSRCQTRQLVTISFASPKAHPFNRTLGGPLNGAYSIGKFVGCGNADALNVVNGMFPGTGNAMTITVGKGVINP